MRSPARCLLIVVLAYCSTFASWPREALAQGAPKVEVVPNARHATQVYQVAYSPDGKVVASASEDETVKLWDVQTGRLIRSLRGHRGSVLSVAFSQDGKLIASGSRERTIRLWEPASGRTVKVLEGHANSVVNVAFSADGHRLLSLGFDGEVRVWDIESGTTAAQFKPDRGLDHWSSYALSPDGKRLIGGRPRQELMIWEVETGRLLEPTHEVLLTDEDYPKVSNDGKWLLVWNSQQDGPKLYEASTGKQLRTFAVPRSGNAEAFDVSRNGRYLVTNGGDRRIWMLDMESGQPLYSVSQTDRSGSLKSIAFSADGSRFVTDELVIHDAATGRIVLDLKPASGSVDTVAVSPDGARIVSGGAGLPAYLWERASGRLVRRLESSADETMSVAYSPDGRLIAAGSEDAPIAIWEASTGRLIRKLGEASVASRSIAFSPEGSRLISGTAYADERAAVQVWDVETGKFLHEMKGGGDSIYSVAISRDGSRVVAGSWDFSVKVWDTRSGKLLRNFDHDRMVISVDFAPDGRHVLSGSTNVLLKLWSVADGKLVRTFKGNAAHYSTRFSRDGKRLLVGGDDNTVRIWDVTKGALLRTFSGDYTQVKSAVFTPDERQILLGSGDGTVRILNARTGAVVLTMMADKDGNWLSMTPHGFFAGTLQASDMIGITRGLEVRGVDQIWQSLYSPDLVREHLAGDPAGEVARAAKVANLDSVLASGAPPRVELVSPAPDAFIKEATLPAKARVTDQGGGIGRVEWRVNGITVGVETPKAATGGSVEIERAIALDDGDNVIELVAYNGRNLVASVPDKRTVRLDATITRSKPRLHVLAIGINAYADPGWGAPGQPVKRYAPLAFAVNDAGAFSDTLKRAAGDLYGEVRITPVLDKAATRDNLDKVIDKLAGEIEPHDTFIFYAAAHGVSQAGRFYILPQDFVSGPDAYAQRAIGQDRLQDWLANRIKARRVLVLLDTCESGAAIAGHGQSRTEAVASEAALGRLHEATGRPVLTAAAAGKPALEGYRGHGVFTWALIDALYNGDTGGNGQVELSELAAHVQSVLPRITAELNGTARSSSVGTPTVVSGHQQAARFGSRGEDFVLGRKLQ